MLGTKTSNCLFQNKYYSNELIVRYSYYVAAKLRHQIYVSTFN